MSQVRVGVIGLGEVAQVTHLPVMRVLHHLYQVTAICDISPTLLTEIGNQYAIPDSARYDDFREMVNLAEIDLVFVLNSDEYHAECAIAAMEAGKHVFVEKPMALTIADAEAMITARDTAGVQLMVGYMRRYAPAFVQAKEYVAAMDSINYVRVRDIIGQNRLFIDQVEHVLRPTDFPSEAMADRKARAERMVREAIGEVPPQLAGNYRLLCGLSSHDLSAMRELIGMPKRVINATSWQGSAGSFIHVTMDFGEYQAVLETGADRQVRFDAHIEVYGDTSSVRIEYDTPYIRHLPTTLHLERTVDEEYTQTVIRPTYADPYTRELEYLYDALTNGTEVKTTAEDSIEDLRLFQWIIEAIQASQS